jgi:hypothetical protein
VGKTKDKRTKLKRHEQVRDKKKKKEKLVSPRKKIGAHARKKGGSFFSLFFSLAHSLKEQVEKTHGSKSMRENKEFE